ncbi:TonB-dependent receptor [Porphyromonas pogonae]|uniref:TonB-dependent receptor n=1 Tax=Porphyromonas pogonae TaxID=867595 RepID=UPI002E79C8D0|nr:TonB-dependent receptor [Porphyromonas pogonae]
MTKLFRWLILPAILLHTFYIQASEPEKIDTIQLHEVVVEASKEHIQFKRVPASVSVLTSDELGFNGVYTMPNISVVMPNLFMHDYGSKLTSSVYIRGIGSRINSPSVGLYVDHVPYYDKSLMNFDLYDINRIEVLRGPQGTEYGRNTMGGIINVTTKSPLQYQGLDVKLQAATYGDYTVSSGYYARPTDKFAYSISGNYLHRDGFFTNKFLNSKVDKINSYGMRNRMNYIVSSKLSFENILNFEISNQGGYPYAIYDTNTQKVEDISYNQYSSYKRGMISDAFLVKYNTDKYELTSATSYQFFKDNQSIDQDFSKDSITYVTQKQNQHLVTQDLTLKSKWSERYNMLIGVNAFYQNFDNNVRVHAYPKKTETFKTYDHAIMGAALFQQTTIKNVLVENLNLTAGLRMDMERDVLKYKYDLITPKGTSTKADTTFKALNSLEFLPKLALTYEMPNHNIYGTIARGYKTGGFNTSFSKPDEVTFKPEYSWNFELGIKSSWFNKNLFTELALFYIDWKDQQIYRTLKVGGAMLINAGHSASKGLEFSFHTAPIHGFELMGSYGFTHAKFLDNKKNDKSDYSGNYIPYVPQNTLSVQLRKTFALAPNGFADKIILSSLYKGAGNFYYNDANTLKQKYYGLLDARISIIRRAVQIDLWANNITNKNYLAHFFVMGAENTAYAQKGKPFQAGVTLSLKFPK